MVTFSSAVQSAKATAPIVSTLSEITADVSFEAPANAASPILVTPSGIVTDVRLVFS